MANAGGEKSPKGITLMEFSDGFDDGLKPGGDGKRYMTEMKTRGFIALREVIKGCNENGHPVTYVVFTHLFAWAAQVAREVNIPCSLLWIEPATLLDIYYYYFNGYGDCINAGSDEIQLPNLPLLAMNDLPMFVRPTTHERFRLLMKEKIDILEGESKARILVNTFDELESDALKSIEKYEFIAVGPLIPSGLFEGEEDVSDKSFGGDFFKLSDDNYIEWLNSKPESSVVYISFGSTSVLPKPQMEEIARGLLDCGRPFIWVIRANEEDDEKLTCYKELEKQGKIVTWCSQLEVLSHPSLGCFFTHCGWNSVLESLTFGIPMVAFPQIFDQPTNAKLVQDFWKTGVRVCKNEEIDLVQSSEIARCIEAVMDNGEESKQLRNNALKWKRLAREAMGEDGSSNKNLNYFVEEILGHKKVPLC